MAKFETIFSVSTWALMNLVLVSLAFETTTARNDSGTVAQTHIASTAAGSRAA